MRKYKDIWLSNIVDTFMCMMLLCIAIAGFTLILASVVIDRQFPHVGILATTSMAAIAWSYNYKFMMLSKVIRNEETK